jgi:hypothetical protein
MGNHHFLKWKSPFFIGNFAHPHHHSPQALSSRSFKAHCKDLHQGGARREALEFFLKLLQLLRGVATPQRWRGQKLERKQS